MKAPITPRPADLRTLRQPGTTPGTEDRAALRLARAIHRAESSDVATSWSAQERAQAFYAEHGLARTLDECTRLEARATLLREIVHRTEPDGRTVRTQLHRTGPREWTVICDQCHGTSVAMTTYRTRAGAEAAFAGHAETFADA